MERPTLDPSSPSVTGTAYDVLGVRPTATQAAIQKRRDFLLRPKRHPGGMPPEAVEAAFAQVGDPVRRTAYDTELVRGATDPSAGGAGLVACQNCGTTSPSLRVARFDHVVSLVFMSWRTHPKKTLLCPPCRGRGAWSSALFSGTLGWWGIPWGLIWTPLAYVHAIRGGKMLATENADLLRRQGFTYARLGDLASARDALVAAQRFERFGAIDTLIAEPRFLALPPTAPERVRPGQIVAGLILVAPIVVFVVLIAALIASDPHTSTTR